VETISCTVAEGVALVLLNRPHRKNAWTPMMRREFRSTMAALETDSAVRTIVITGAGQDFCVGGDMEVLDLISENGAMGLPEREPISDQLFGTSLGTFGFLLKMSKPVIAAINGPAAGVGLILAMFCDVRFAAADCKLAVAMSRLGLPAEQGMSWILPRLIGSGRAADLLFAGRVIRGEEAERIGLVNWVLPREEVLESAMEYARGIARQISPASLRMMKVQLYADLANDLPASIELAEKFMGPAVKGADYREGIEALRQHRLPRFES
jgi:enoyl-CoA hydratase/carnithine racemase